MGAGSRGDLGRCLEGEPGREIGAEWSAVLPGLATEGALRRAVLGYAGSESSSRRGAGHQLSTAVGSHWQGSLQRWQLKSWLAGSSVPQWDPTPAGPGILTAFCICETFN